MLDVIEGVDNFFLLLQKRIKVGYISVLFVPVNMFRAGGVHDLTCRLLIKGRQGI
jgi:hypothetical protein